MHVHEALHGHHERVAEPLGELVERDDVLPWVRGVRGHDAALPGVADGDAVDLRARGGPDGGEAID